MAERVSERRRSVRTTAAYPVSITDHLGRFLTKGRAANISEHGLFVVAGMTSLKLDQHVLVMITVPSRKKTGRSDVRTVRYICRIVRKQTLGQLLGLGMELLEKLDTESRTTAPPRSANEKNCAST